MWNDDKHVITCAAMVVWDGITKPESDEAKPGILKHNIRVAIPGDAPELAEIQELVQNALNDSKWKGKWLKDVNNPISEADVDKLGPRLDGHFCFTAATQRGTPPILDLQGAELSAMQFSRSFYPGAMVKLMIHAYAYDNKQKGINIGLDGIQVVDTTTPALPIGGGISATRVMEAFGGTPAASNGVGYTMTAKADNTRAEYHKSGWTDEMLIAEGMMLAPKAAAPAPKPSAPPPKPSAPPPKPAAPPPRAAPAPAPKAPPPNPTAPHSTILAGPAHTMTEAAECSYEEYIAAGWDDEGLIAGGLMVVAPAKPKGPPPPPGKPKTPPPPPKRTGPVMTENAESTYEEYIAAGWDDEGLIAADFMVAP